MSTTTHNENETPSMDPTASPAEAGGTKAARNSWALVARREIAVRILDKGFLIGTVVTIALLAAFFGWTAYSEGRSSTFAVVTTAEDAAMGEALTSVAPMVDESVAITSSTVADEEAGRAAVAEGDADGFLHQGDGGWVLVTESRESGLLSLTQEAVRAATIDAQARELGTTVAELQAGSVVTAQFLVGDAERAGLAQAIGFIMALLFFMFALMYGMQIANSVVEEKQSRIVEIIATAIPLRHLLAGKVLGSTAMALLQIVLYVGIGLIGMSFTEYGAFIPAISGAIGWFVVFFLAGFVALACLWAVAGSLASRTEDVANTSAPLTYIIMGIYFASFLLTGNAMVIASFIPPVSTVLMPMRLLEGGVPFWQPVAALALLVGFALLTIIIGERLYRRSLLQSGGRISMRQAWTAPE
ncbi:MAG: ABC transporter permease [Actinomycetia bacterium]|nr:ABC transporter permease [Actinomycetes bacterium]